MGTFRVEFRGQKFALVGRSSIGGTEERIAPGQVEHLRDFYEHFPKAAAVRRGTSGPIDFVFNASAAATLRVWRDALAWYRATIR